MELDNSEESNYCLQGSFASNDLWDMFLMSDHYMVRQSLCVKEHMNMT